MYGCSGSAAASTRLRRRYRRCSSCGDGEPVGSGVAGGGCPGAGACTPAAVQRAQQAVHSTTAQQPAQQPEQRQPKSHLDVGAHVLGMRDLLQEGQQLEQLIVRVVVIPVGGDFNQQGGLGVSAGKRSAHTGQVGQVGRVLLQSQSHHNRPGRRPQRRPLLCSAPKCTNCAHHDSMGMPLSSWKPKACGELSTMMVCARSRPSTAGQGERAAAHGGMAGPRQAGRQGRNGSGAQLSCSWRSKLNNATRKQKKTRCERATHPAGPAGSPPRTQTRLHTQVLPCSPVRSLR